MPIQAPQWTEFLSCPVCRNEFVVAVRSPISLGCGHTICKACLSNLHRKQCPFDQTTIVIDIESLPINTALLQLVSNSNSNLNSNSSSNSTKATATGDKNKEEEKDKDNVDFVDFKVVSRENISFYNSSKKCVEELALYLKPFSNGGNICSSSAGILSRPMQRKLVTLINCQLVEDEGKTRAMRAARSLGERTVTELILQHQNPQQLSANLWAAVRARGCQFLGPAMQEEVLKLVLLALEDGSALSRKVLVMFVVQRLEPHFPQASKTSIGHVVQLLYRASCFKVSKREGDSSLMQLKEEFRTYEALRREHDAQIVQIATEAGLRIAPDQWSALLYGDTDHKSHMQSIIDKLQTPGSFQQSVQELVIALQRTGDPGKLSVLRPHLELLAKIDPSPESPTPTWKECSEALEAVRQVVAGLVDFIHQHGSRKVQDPAHSQHAKYKISMCRDLTLRGSCPRGTNCTFAHSNEELEKYRAKNRKSVSVRNKEHRSENQSPNNVCSEKSSSYCPGGEAGAGGDFYSIPNTTTVSPVSIPTVPIPRMGYDVSYNHSFPAAASPYANPQPQIYSTNPAAGIYPAPEQIYPTSPHNLLLTNGTQFFAPQTTDFSNNSAANVGELAKRQNWDMSNKSHFSLPSKSRSSTKSLAELHQRKQEVISQLEKVVGKNAATAISNSASNLARQESQHDLDSPTSPYTFWAGHTGPTFVRSDSILADDDYVPYDAPCVSKYGPISRMPKDNPQLNASYRDPCMGSSHPMGRRQVSTASTPTSWFYNPSQQIQAAIAAGHTLVASPGASISDGYIIQSPTVIMRMQDPGKELLAESQRVKLQLRNLEKQLNDLKLAAQGVTTLSEGERLTQELQLIEQGIQEKHKEACLNRIVSSLANFNNGNPVMRPSDAEAMYEEDIANDMRELELRWQEELEEEEKRWSSEDDSTTNNKS